MAGYTRQDTANNIANGNVIDADDFDAEFNEANLHSMHPQVTNMMVRQVKVHLLQR